MRFRFNINLTTGDSEPPNQWLFERIERLERLVRDERKEVERLKVAAAEVRSDIGAGGRAK